MKQQVINAYILGESVDDIALEIGVPRNEVLEIIRDYNSSRN